ncbi:hypothetical protein L3X38_024334 [Prunus dulcis]|uniref:DUF4218 domain-containing protein n=1 Tax=Prunus dulcis TaxID=3755 RepID=A0AAD4W251_PRUDU|nr:hypothetical protein L3X38_024334 [Prunus dulcis]
MHVEKNVFDTLGGTILDIEGKTKDTIKARLDLGRMAIRRGLWMNRDSDKARMDLAFFSMKPNDKKEFLKFVSFVKFPDGYASNIARCLRHDIVQVLCKFEMIFPPAFFTSMMHVMVHLPEEAFLAGPVNYRWMYPIESVYDLEGRTATTLVPRSFPSVTVEPAAIIFSIFTESAPPSFSLLRRPNPTPEMSDLIRRCRAVTTTQSSEPPAQPTSAATAPALMDHLEVGPVGSQAPASSAS